MRRLDFRSKKKNRHTTSLSLLSTAHPLKRRILRGVYFFSRLWNVKKKKKKAVSIVGTAVLRLLVQFLKAHCVCVCNYSDYSESRPRLKKASRVFTLCMLKCNTSLSLHKRTYIGSKPARSFPPTSTSFHFAGRTSHGERAAAS